MSDLSRRQLLARGGALTALTALSLGLLGHRPLPDQASAALGSAGLQTLEAALQALLPDDVPAADVAAGVDRFLAAGDPFDVEQLRMALAVLEHGASPFRRFSRMDLSRRRAVLADWERSRVALFRQIFQALRRVAVYSWFADPRSWAQIGYDGPLVRP